MIVYYTESKYQEEAIKLANKLNIKASNEIVDDVYLKYSDEGLSLVGNDMEIKADFNKMYERIKRSGIQSELLVKASKIKGQKDITILDATAGFGDDSFLLAASGANVILYEYNPVIYSLLADSITRALKDEKLSDIASRMKLFEGDSIEAMNTLKEKVDIIYLDPMFPSKEKNSLVKKKFQILHLIEAPCSTEEELLNAAIKAKPKKVIVKRPIKGEELSNNKPSYSIKGKAIRYDCYINN